jgi:hypothetical protein
MPTSRLGIIERAFEIARSGEVQEFEEIPRTLINEGYADVHQQLGGASIRKQLRELCRDAASNKLQNNS